MKNEVMGEASIPSNPITSFLSQMATNSRWGQQRRTWVHDTIRRVVCHESTFARESGTSPTSDEESTGRSCTRRLAPISTTVRKKSSGTEKNVTHRVDAFRDSYDVRILHARQSKAEPEESENVRTSPDNEYNLDCVHEILRKMYRMHTELSHTFFLVVFEKDRKSVV